MCVDHKIVPLTINKSNSTFSVAYPQKTFKYVRDNESGTVYHTLFTMKKSPLLRIQWPNFYWLPRGHNMIRKDWSYTFFILHMSHHQGFPIHPFHFSTLSSNNSSSLELTKPLHGYASEGEYVESEWRLYAIPLYKLCLINTLYSFHDRNGIGSISLIQIKPRSGTNAK